MIIESQFKDYYDYFARQYPDKKTVYKRVTSTIESKAFPELQKFYNDHTFDHTGHAQLSKLANIGGVSVLVVGGRVFPFKKWFTESKGYYLDFKDPYSEVRKARKKNSSSAYLFRFSKSTFGELQCGSRNDQAADLCRQLGAPAFLVNAESTYNRTRYRYETLVELNPILKDISPPCTTFEVYQWIMEILQSVEPVIPEQTNKDKIEQHGYDLKRSFRPKMK